MNAEGEPSKVCSALSFTGFSQVIQMGFAISAACVISEESSKARHSCLTLKVSYLLPRQFLSNQCYGTGSAQPDLKQGTASPGARACPRAPSSANTQPHSLQVASDAPPAKRNVAGANQSGMLVNKLANQAHEPTKVQICCFMDDPVLNLGCLPFADGFSSCSKHAV